MSQLKYRSGFGRVLSGGLLAALGLLLATAIATQAALVDGGNGPQLLIGR